MLASIKFFGALAGVIVIGGGVWWLRSDTAAAVHADPIETGARPGGGDLDFEALEAMLDEGEFDRVEAALPVPTATEADGRVLLLRSILARKRGDADAAVEWGAAAAEALPERSDAHLAYARALGDSMMSGGLMTAMRYLGTYKEELQLAIDLDPTNIDARQDQIGFFLMAPSMAGGDVERARALAEELVTRDRRRGLTLLAWAMSASEEIDAAIELCRAGLTEFPHDGALNVMLASILQEEERFEEADDAYADALLGERDEAYYQALYQRGKLRIELEFELEEAIALFEQYIEAEPAGQMLPPVAGAWWRIGNAHELRGALTKARAAYVEAVRIDPEFEQAREALDDLE